MGIDLDGTGYRSEIYTLNLINNSAKKILNVLDQRVCIEKNEHAALRDSRSFISAKGDRLLHACDIFDNCVGVSVRNLQRAICAAPIADEDFQVVLPYDFRRELLQHSFEQFFFIECGNDDANVGLM
jgi:hypothetical protein